MAPIIISEKVAVEIQTQDTGIILSPAQFLVAIEVEEGVTQIIETNPVDVILYDDLTGPRGADGPPGSSSSEATEAAALGSGGVYLYVLYLDRIMRLNLSTDLVQISTDATDFDPMGSDWLGRESLTYGPV